MYRSVYALALALALFGAAPSQAGIVFAEFDLSGSQLSFAGITVADGAGARVSGSARVTLMIDGEGPPGGPTIQPSLRGLELTFDVQRQIPGLDATLSGSVRFRQLDGPIPTGTFDGMTFRIPESFLDTELFGLVSCTGSQCILVPQVTTIRSLPLLLNSSFRNMGQPFEFTIGGFGTDHLTLGAFFSSMNSDGVVSVRLSGRQVPEPLETGLLLLGVLAICGSAAVRRSRTA